MTVAPADDLATALRYHETGDLARARAIYVRVLEADPARAEAWHLLGMLVYQAGDPATAAELVGRAVGLDPNQALYHTNLGTVLRDAGDLPGAVASYRRAVELAPTADNLNNLGTGLLTQGHADAAAECFRIALRFEPGHALAHNNLGNALGKLGRRAEAIESYRQAIAARPDYAEAHNNLGEALLARGHRENAESAFREALRLRPNLVEALVNLGSALEAGKRHAEAEAAYREALRLRPRSAPAHNNLGNLLRNTGRAAEAVASYREALAIRPGYARAATNLGIALLQLGDIPAAIAAHRTAVEADPAFAEAHSNLLFALNCDPTTDADELFAAHVAWGQAHAPTTEYTPHKNDRDPDRVLRIGYVSPDLRGHAVARYLEPVLRRHDPNQVEVFCYAQVPHPDAVTERLRGVVPHWRDTCGLSDDELAAQIRADRIDILIDLAGHTGGNRLMAFARKPAPVQATWLGYPNTTGLPQMDFLISDAGIHPPGEPTRTTEEVVRLETGIVTFSAPTNAPPVTEPPVGRTGVFTFGSLHGLGKFNPPVFDLWARVLAAVPAARLLMYRDTFRGETVERLANEFTSRGVEPGRVEFRCDPPPGGYLAVYGDIDLALDVFPWAGGTTVCEALWMGVPTLTLRGPRFGERGGASVMTTVGVPEFITGSPNGFVAQAVEHASNPARLAELRGRLRAMTADTLGNAERFTRGLEAPYRGMWRRWCGGARASY
jgi:protein O-GlcNAc transferase